MTTELREFIEQNIDLIEDNNFTELYRRCPIEDRGKLTAVLYVCGIDPLQYTAEIPALFAYEANITNITIPNNVTIIDRYAFSYCSSLTTIEIPSSVTRIGSYAFYYCDNLTSITIPESVTSIGDYAFKDCGNLQITYSGTKQQWKHLVMSLEIFPKTTYVCNCLDGVVEKNGDDI